MLENLIKEINEAKCYSPYWLDDVVDMGEAMEVDVVDRDDHRWYTLATVVFDFPNGDLLGVRGPINLKSESMSFDDLEIPCQAFEMEAVPSVTYRKKGEES